MRNILTLVLEESEKIPPAMVEVILKNLLKPKKVGFMNFDLTKFHFSLLLIVFKQLQWDYDLVIIAPASHRLFGDHICLLVIFVLVRNPACFTLLINFSG